MKYVVLLISMSWRGHKDTFYLFNIGFSCVSCKLILKLSEGLQTLHLFLILHWFCKGVPWRSGQIVDFAMVLLRFRVS